MQVLGAGVVAVVLGWRQEDSTKGTTGGEIWRGELLVGGILNSNSLFSHSLGRGGRAVTLKKIPLDREDLKNTTD